MAGVVFIGDELSATGFRLTGIDVVTPAPAETAEALEQARQRAALVLITAECASLVPQPVLEQAMMAGDAVVTIVPDIRGRVQPPDLARRLRSTLGIEA